MLKRIVEYKKFKDIINFKETEVWFSITLDIIICFFLGKVQFYNDFSQFVSTLSNVINAFIGGLIGIIGFSLSGMAIMVSLFDKKQIQMIDKLNGEGKIEQIMSSYAFLAFFSALVIVMLAGLSLAIASGVETLSVIPFWIIVFMIIYAVLFNILYAVALVFNCIYLFGIKQVYDEKKDEKILPVANEIRIDYLMKILVQICNLKREDVMKHLENEAGNMPEEERAKLKEYFDAHYPTDEK